MAEKLDLASLVWIAFILMVIAVFPVQADELENDPYTIPVEQYIAQVDQEPESNIGTGQPSRSVPLVLPNSLNQRNNQDAKKCMTVCTKWGEDCIIDPNRGRKCRRTCKEFGEECF